MGEDVYVGIDVSKTQLVVAVRPSGESFTRAYDRAGLKQVVGRLSKLQAKLVVEATGGLQRQIVAALWTAGVAGRPSIQAGCGATRGVADY
jgi:transposase